MGSQLITTLYYPLNKSKKVSFRHWLTILRDLGRFSPVNTKPWPGQAVNTVSIRQLPIIMLDFSKDKTKISTILQKLPIFVGLSAAEYEHIDKICVPVTVPKNEAIFTEGENSNCMYVLIFGTVQLRTQNKGIIHTVEPGEVFGEIGFINQQKRTASAVTSETSILLQIDTQAFQNLVEKHPRISFTIMRNITLSLADHISRMNQTSTLDYLPKLREH